jgi:membrane-bound ClpP family serine protease
VTIAILLLGLGLALVVAEVLFPSFGVLSILATMAIVGAVVMAFRVDSSTGFNFLAVTIALLPATVFLGLKVFPHSPIGKKMVASGLSFEGEAATDVRDRGLRDVEGEVEADCRPAGVARLDGRRVDVVTRGEWIEAGERIKVVEVSGNRVVVVRAPSTPV